MSKSDLVLKVALQGALAAGVLLAANWAYNSKWTQRRGSSKDDQEDDSEQLSTVVCKQGTVLSDEDEPHTDLGPVHSPEGTKVTQGSAPGKSAAASNPTTDGPADDMYGVRGDNGHPASTLGGDAGDASTAHASGLSPFGAKPRPRHRSKAGKAPSASPARDPTPSAHSSALGSWSISSTLVAGFQGVKELVQQLAGPSFAPPPACFEPLASPASEQASRLSQGHRSALANTADAVKTSGNPAAAVDILTQVPRESESKCVAALGHTNRRSTRTLTVVGNILGGSNVEVLAVFDATFVSLKE